MKTAICFTTKYGSSEHAAEELKRQLAGEIDLFNIKKNPPPNLDSYDIVVLGGSVYMGKVQREMQQFITSHLNTLLQKKVGLYLCAGYPDVAVLEKQYGDSFPEPLRVHSTAKGFFGYEVQFEKAGLFDRMLLKKMMKASTNVSALDNDAIKQFAKMLTP